MLQRCPSARCSPSPCSFGRIPGPRGRTPTTRLDPRQPSCNSGSDFSDERMIDNALVKVKSAKGLMSLICVLCFAVKLKVHEDQGSHTVITVASRLPLCVSRKKTLKRSAGRTSEDRDFRMGTWDSSELYAQCTCA